MTTCPVCGTLSIMDLRVVTRRSTCDEVFEQLADNIMRGDVAAGDSLLSERRLAELLGVSRPIVREALQRLAHAGLIEVRQGGSTRVRDFKRQAGLNILAQLLLRDGKIDLSVARSVVEARFLVGPQIAALAAERAAVQPLRDALAQLEQDRDPISSQHHALAFWELLVDGADSIVFRLMFNSMRAAYEPLLAALAPVLGPETGRLEGYWALVDAIAVRDSDAARHAAQELLAPTTKTLLDAIGGTP